LTVGGTIGADSTAAATFPPGVGSVRPGLTGDDADLPTLTCFQSETGAVWLPVTDFLCALVETPEGNLAIVLVGGNPGWFFYFVAVF
jgi:hypothetical protein